MSLVKVPTRSLAKYDPQRGVKRIAVAAMAEKHYAKAKDASQLEKAIRAKLEAQAEFIFWWDSQGPGAKHGGLRPGSGRKKSRS